MKNKFILLITPVVFCWCLFYLQACKEPLIGDKGLLDKSDLLNVAKDTLKLKISSEFQKQVLASSVTSGAVGSLYDPNFGSTYASFYAQMSLTSDNVSFGTYDPNNTNIYYPPVLDSVVLTLQYNGQYGSFTKPVDIYVYQVNNNQNFSDTLSFYTNTSFQVNLPPIGVYKNFLPFVPTLCACPTDSEYILGVEYPKHLRIPLTNTFGNKIIKADSTSLSTNDNFFHNIFQGVYITTASNKLGNGVEYFDLSSALSKITVYYHNALYSSLYYDLPVAGTTVDHFDNIYTNTPANAAITKPSTAVGGDETMYIQAGGGTQGKIIINIDSILKRAAINRAELVLTVDASDTFQPPALLELYRIDDAGVGQHLEDEAELTYGGTLLTETVNGVGVYRYRFNIQHYFQKLVQGIYRNNGLYVLSTTPGTSTERLKIRNSSTDKNYQITLAVTYTKL